MIDTVPEHPGSERRGLTAYRELVRSSVGPERFAHIERVVDLAKRVGEANRFSPEELARVELAALLHDAARDLDDAELLRLAPPENQVEIDHPLSVHGRAGRRMAEQWGVTDETVLEAIEGHVFGVPLANRVGTAVYVADVCEPGRGVNHDLRELALSDLDAAYRQAVAVKVDYLRRSGKEVHPATLAAYASL
ncbi:MAG TPA: bis(5'-nucleosyl)-tetraphosphatase (symmetrical) YqeK [Trueperaceae bacterium]|nr:bis(5'-nucleosyl)-tetraphosphatase (symmetrical) YqeK [Trueperaceae bacterium]